MEETVPVDELKRWRLWQALRRCRFFAESSAGVVLTDVERAEAWRGFCERHRVHPETGSTENSELAGLDAAALRGMAELERRVAKWKNSTFAADVPALFEREKATFETVVYSLLPLRSPGLARELWFRISDGETTFPDAAREYAEGAQKFTGGIVGPVPWSGVHPTLATQLRSAGEGRLAPPFRLGEMVAIARLEKVIEPVLDPRVEQILIERLAMRRFSEEIE